MGDAGGHTSEALRLISALDFCRYTPRTYIISNGDTLSSQKAVALEKLKANSASPQIVSESFGLIESCILHGLIDFSQSRDTDNQYKLLIIPRARYVHQSLLLTPPTAFLSLLVCIYHVTVAPLFLSRSPRSPFADVLILNGPGTCFVLCGAIYLNKVSIPNPPPKPW